MHKSKLNKYASKSELMNMSIKYGDEHFKFNLFEELAINENVINKELRGQTQSQAFLAILHKKLIRLAADKKIELDKQKARVWLKGKKDQINGRVPTKEDLRAMVDADIKSIKLSQLVVDLEHQCNLLETCVRTFETRAHMLQTVSANTRNR